MIKNSSTFPLLAAASVAGQAKAVRPDPTALSMSRRMKFAALALALVALAFQGVFASRSSAEGNEDLRPKGLQPQARQELAHAGVNKYVGLFLPSASEKIGDWTKYTFDPQGGDGPICIAGSEFAVFHQARDPKNLMIILDGGGACWQGFYDCRKTSGAYPPPAAGIFAHSGARIDNPLADWSKIFMSYCDGSTFWGDNTVIDPSFSGGIRHHRGLRNLTAALDLARDLHPNAKQVLL